MSQEIVEAVQVLGREGHLRGEAHGGARRRAPLHYKKQPGAAKYARDDGSRVADFRVGELLVPADLEERLLSPSRRRPRPTSSRASTRRRARCASGRPEVELERLRAYEDQIETRDVTPHDFGRIAAQTAKQVILQRIREAERDMMFEEYRPRRRADHQHRPAVRLALHARATRARRGAAAEVEQVDGGRC